MTEKTTDRAPPLAPLGLAPPHLLVASGLVWAGLTLSAYLCLPRAHLYAKQCGKTVRLLAAPKKLP